MSDQAKGAMEEANKISSFIPEFYIDIFSRVIPGGLIIFFWFPGLIFEPAQKTKDRTPIVFTANHSTTNLVDNQLYTITGKLPLSDFTNEIIVKLTMSKGSPETNGSNVIIVKSEETNFAHPDVGLRQIPDFIRYLLVFVIAWLLGAAWEKFIYAIYDFGYKSLKCITLCLLSGLQKSATAEQGLSKESNNTKSIKTIFIRKYLKAKRFITGGDPTVQNLGVLKDIYDRRLYLRAMSEGIMFRSIVAILALKVLILACEAKDCPFWPIDSKFLERLSTNPIDLFSALAFATAFTWFHVWRSVRQYPVTPDNKLVAKK